MPVQDTLRCTRGAPLWPDPAGSSDLLRKQLLGPPGATLPPQGRHVAALRPLHRIRPAQSPGPSSGWEGVFCKRSRACFHCLLVVPKGHQTTHLEKLNQRSRFAWQKPKEGTPFGAFFSPAGLSGFSSPYLGSSRGAPFGQGTGASHSSLARAAFQAFLRIAIGENKLTLPSPPPQQRSGGDRGGAGR